MISPLHRRVLEISYRRRLGHLSSNLTAVDIIDEIYRTKRPQDLFVLSAGHAGLALYVNLEKHEGKDAEDLYARHKTHPHRNVNDGIHVSAGSLGCGVTIALGMALADPSRDVHVLVSDGESFEGSFWETLLVKGKQPLSLPNLKIWVNDNGYSCVEDVSTNRARRACAMEAAAGIIDNRYHGLKVVDTRGVYDLYPFLRGVQAHYHQLTPEDWAWVEENS